MTTVLERLAAAAQQLVDARYAAIGVPDDDATGDGFAQFIHVGMSDELVDAIGPLPRTHGLLGSMLLDPVPYRTDNVRADPRFTWWPAAHPRMRSFLGVPIVFKGDVVGAFYLADKEGGGEFTDDDESLIGLLAAHAAIAIENARLYERSRELSIVEERNRIALELHDATAQTLFSIRLAADTALGFMATDPDRAAAELATVRELAGAATGELRSLIFALRPASVAEDGLVVALRKHLDLIGRTHQLGVKLVADEVGDLPADVEADLYRVAQEALTNVVRHASAAGSPGDRRPDAGRDHAHRRRRRGRLRPAGPHHPGPPAGIDVDGRPHRPPRGLDEGGIGRRPGHPGHGRGPPPVIRVVVVDDHPIVRQGLRSYLSSREGIEVVGDAGDGESAVAMVGELRPDVVLMDLVMPGMGGLAAIGAVVALGLGTRDPGADQLLVGGPGDPRHPGRRRRLPAQGRLARGGGGGGAGRGRRRGPPRPVAGGGGDGGRRRAGRGRPGRRRPGPADAPGDRGPPPPG